jgi:hypothetical protein
MIQQNEAGVARGNNILEITAGTLAANVGAYAPAAADSGRYTTNNTATPANENSDATLAAFGPGEGNWLAEDVDAVTVILNNAVAVANARVGLNAKNLNAGNLEVDVHSLEAGIPGVVDVRLVYEPPVIR